MHHSDWSVTSIYGQLFSWCWPLNLITRTLWAILSSLSYFNTLACNIWVFNPSDVQYTYRKYMLWVPQHAASTSARREYLKLFIFCVFKMNVCGGMCICLSARCNAISSCCSLTTGMVLNDSKVNLWPLTCENLAISIFPPHYCGDYWCCIQTSPDTFENLFRCENDYITAYSLSA